MSHPHAPVDLIESLAQQGSQWFTFLDRQIWPWPDALDSQPCMVYGTGYSSWGAWAQINAALFVASSLRWPASAVEQIPPAWRPQEKRRELALSLTRYAMGCHTTGPFNSASNNRWGGSLQSADEKESYDNWHAPLWTSLLAEAVFTLGDDAPPVIVRRLKLAVAHDAQAQAELGLFNFDGRADEQAGHKSHPESNAWKAMLLLLARGLCKDDPRAGAWHQRELRLWASSLAIPGDERSEEIVDGQPVRELAVGNHLTPSFNVIHHGFLHPCYKVFSLLPRMMAARFSGRLGATYPQAASRHEAKVFTRLMGLHLPGRLVYPAGQDWPRWVYGQAYFLPLLIHRMHVDGVDHLEAITELAATRRRDASASRDGSFILHRFGELLETRAWAAHRYESDMASSLAMAITLLQDQSRLPAGRPAQPMEDLPPRCHEPMAQTVYEKREHGFLAMSTRACQGPVQLTALPPDDPHLLEWQSNGCMSAVIRNHMNPGRVEIEQAHLMLDGHRGWSGQVQFDYAGGPTYHLAGAQFIGRLMAAAPAQGDGLLVHQSMAANCHGFIDRITLHQWRIAQSPQNGMVRRLTHQGGEVIVQGDDTLEMDIDSPWVCVDGRLCLSLLEPDDDPSATPLRWHLRQLSSGSEATTSDNHGSRWLELSVTVRRSAEARTHTGQLLAQAAIAVSLDGQPMRGRYATSPQGVDITLPGMADPCRLTWQAVGK